MPFVKQPRNITLVLYQQSLAVTGLLTQPDWKIRPGAPLSVSDFV